MDSGLVLRTPRNDSELFLIDVAGIKQPVRIGEDQLGRAALTFDLAIEARAPPGVAGSPDLRDTDPDCVLVAIGAHLDHALCLTRGLTFSPQGIARAAEVPGLAGRDRLAQRLVVHVRDHL